MEQTDAISRARVLSTLEAEKGRLIAQKGNDWPFTGEMLAKAVDTVIDFIKWIPALDVAPVVHARWIPYDEARPGMYFSHRCSNCGGSVEHAYLMRPSSFSDFCPNCGARMDGEAE